MVKEKVAFSFQLLSVIDLERRTTSALATRSYLWVFKGLPFHDVTPVTSGIANGEENQLVAFFCSFEGLRTPGVPMDWI